MPLPSMISWELLFWLPTIQDLLLLVFTYGSFRLKGYEWFFEWKDAEEYNASLKNNKKSDDDSGGDDTSKKAEMKELSAFGKERVEAVWELAMIAYSAYGVLLPLATYWCYKYPELRVDFCWAMTILMVFKLFSLRGKQDTTSVQSRLTLWVFYLPTYGGYATMKTFLN